MIAPVQKTRRKFNPVKAKVVYVSTDGQSVKVEIESVVAHKRYVKRLHRISSFHADTAGRKVQVGNLVGLIPCRRVSKDKTWKVIEIFQ